MQGWRRYHWSGPRAVFQGEGLESRNAKVKYECKMQHRRNSRGPPLLRITLIEGDKWKDGFQASETSPQHPGQLRSRGRSSTVGRWTTEHHRQALSFQLKQASAARSPFKMNRPSSFREAGWEDKLAPRARHVGAAALNSPHGKPLSVAETLADVTCLLIKDISNFKQLRREILLEY